MKSKSALRSFLLLAGSTWLAASSVHSATLTWDANGATAGQTDGAGSWDTATELKWWTGATNVDWTSGDSAIFGNAGTGGTVTLASPTTVGSLSVGFFSGTYTLGSSGQAITLNNNISRFGGQVGTVNISSPLTLVGAQTWTNHANADAPLNLNAATTLAGNLTVDGSGITNSVATAAVIGGSGNIIKNGTGQFNFSAGGTTPTHTFTGDIVVNGGSIGFQNSGVLAGRNAHLTDGYLGGRSNSGFTWSGGLGTGADQIRITDGTSGLSGEGNTNSGFQIGAALDTLVWGASGEGGATGFFNPDVLLLNGNQRMNTNGKGSLNNAIDLNGATRTITSTQVTDGASTSGFTVSGAITTGGGTAGLIKTGTGNLILTANNAYNGATTIRSDNAYSTATTPYLVTAPGSITLSGANGRISNTSALNLTSGGTLRMVSTNAQNVVDRINSAAITVAGGGGLWWENAAGANSFAETLGAATVNSGTFNVNLTTDQTAAGSQTLTLGTLTRNGTSSVAFSAGGTGPQASGNKNMIAVSAAGTTALSEIIGAWATTGTSPIVQTDYAVYTADHVTSLGNAAGAESSWSTTHAATSNYTLSHASGTSADGRLTTARNINTLRNITPAGGNITVDAGTDFVTLLGNSFSDGDVVLLGTSAGGVTFGVPYFVRDKSGDTFKLALSDGGAAVDITGANTGTITGGLTLGANNLGTFGILNGSATPLMIGGSTGSITLPTAGAGQLHINTGRGAINSNAPIIDNGGALTLVKSGNPAVNITNNNYSTQGTLVLNGINTYTGDTIINGGTLRIGSNAFANGAKLGGASGIYAGNIQINGGGLLYVSTNSNQTLSGVISGDGSLMKTNSGALVLSGANTYTGKTSISPATTGGAGALVVSSFNSVNGGTPLLASSSLGAPTTVANGTIDLGGPANIQGPAILRYTGSGETTDRVINIRFGSNTSRIIETNGTGLLKFTSPFIFENLGQATVTTVTFQGSGNGEIVGGLPSAGGYAVSKSGSGTWTIGGPVGHSGVTTVSVGTLILNGSKPGSGAVAVNGTSTLGGTGTIAGPVTVAATANLSPGASAGTLTFTGDLNISAMTGSTGVMNFELGPIAASDKIIAGTINIGELAFNDFNFSTLTGLENGTYTLIQSGGITGSLDPDSGDITGTIGAGPATGTLQITGNNIQLVVSGVPGVGSAYDTWKAANAPGSNPNDDTDGDGVSNAVEFVLGGTSATKDLDKLPVAATAGTDMTFTFKRAQSSIDPKTALIIETSTDLVTWNTAPSPYTVPDGAVANNPGVTVVKDSPSVGTDTVTLTVPRTPDTRKFARLRVVITP